VLCENCKEREGILTVTTVVGGESRKVLLCEKCAAERGVEPEPVPAPQIGQLLQKLHQQPAMSGPGGVIRDQGRCDFCSATLGDFRATGRLGCPRCYAAFETSLRDLLRRVHGSARHIGRQYEAPQRDELQRQTQVGELRAQLKRAIEAEQFELAADIRDRLRVLE
jgi:protein arginine kinase activator